MLDFSRHDAVNLRAIRFALILLVLMFGPSPTRHRGVCSRFDQSRLERG
jgi:hypothetical protein